MNLSSHTPSRLFFEDSSTSFEVPRLGRGCRELWLSAHQISQLRFLSETSYPFEACGLLVGSCDDERIEVCEIVQARNLDRRSQQRYELDPEDLVATDADARRRGYEIVGVWHSHPNHPPKPSANDLESAWEGYSYVIVSVDALGDTVVGSWRLEDGRLWREDIRVASTP